MREDEPLIQVRRRHFVLTPAAATVLFFLAQLFFFVTDPQPSTKIAGATAEAPVPMPVKVRVVAEIRSLDDVKRPKAKVPATEAALLDLLRREGSVIFSSEEVEVVATPEQSFGPEEVDVIRLRRATFAGH